MKGFEKPGPVFKIVLKQLKKKNLSNEWSLTHGQVKLSTYLQKLKLGLFNIYPIVIACLLWGNKWCRKNISFLCDDKSTVNILKSRSDNPFINRLIRRLTWICVNNFILKATFLPHINNKADTLSHFKFQEFHAHCPEAHPSSLLARCSAKLS